MHVESGAALARPGIRLGETVGGAGAHLPFRETDCIRSLLPAAVIAAAEERAEALGIGADRVLIASGAIDEESYLRALGEQLGVAFEPLDGVPRALCPIGDERLVEAAANGMLPLADGDDLCLVVAPRAAAVRRIGALIAEHPEQARHFRFSSNDRIVRFALRCAGKTVAARAADGLKQTHPRLSAAPPRWRGKVVPLTIAGLWALAAALLATPATTAVTGLILAAVFLAWLALRLVGALIDRVWCDSFFFID